MNPANLSRWTLTPVTPVTCPHTFPHLIPTQIWDLVANKQLSELAGHTHSVTGLHFHPVEYLLGTCSADKTIKVRSCGACLPGVGEVEIVQWGLWRSCAHPGPPVPQSANSLPLPLPLPCPCPSSDSSYGTWRACR